MSDVYQAAAHLLRAPTLRNGLLPSVCNDETESIDWEAVRTVYPLLSSGEQALVDTATELVEGGKVSFERCLKYLDSEHITYVLGAEAIRQNLTLAVSQ